MQILPRSSPAAVLLCVAAFVLGFPCSVTLAQTETATITGRITDPDGRAVPDAEVQAVRIATNTAVTTKTNAQGLYAINGLQPGQYRLILRKEGFREIVKADLVLQVQDVVAQNFALQVGSIEESITVTGGAPLVNTESAAVGNVVDRQFVENIPLNGRSFQSLLTLIPGVTLAPSTASVNRFGEITVNGQRTESNYFTVDGVSANTGTAPANFVVGGGYAGSIPGQTALGTTQGMVSIDALEEFHASTSTYSAEYGRSPGGQFSLVTRSGSNHWHGSAFDYVRNDAMDANFWFNNLRGLPRLAERQNDFGGTFGGPVFIPAIYRGMDRTFFFFSYEGLRLLQPQSTVQTTVPDLSLRQNASAAVQPVLNAFPSPNGSSDGLGDGLAFYNEAVSFPSQVDATSVRVDHTIRDRVKIFGRLAETPSSASSYSGATKFTAQDRSRTVTFGETIVVGTKQTNEMRFNVAFARDAFHQSSTNLGNAVPFDLKSLPGPNGQPFPESGSQFEFLLQYGPFASFILSDGATVQHQLNLVDVHKIVLAAHNLKLGLDWRRLSTTVSPVTIDTAYFYTNQASVLNNRPSLAQNFPFALVPFNPVYSNYSVFLQDDYRIHPRLSVFLGLRWDINPAPITADGPAPVTVDQVQNLATTKLASRGSPLWRTYWRGFAPRLGAAYRLASHPNYETVVRSGFGIFYDLGNINGSQGFDGFGMTSSAGYTNASFPLTSAQLQLPMPSINPPYGSAGAVYGFDPNLKLPRTFHWNMAVEQAIAGRQAITMSYVGSAGRDLLNQYTYFPATLGNPNFAPNGQLVLTLNRGISDYNSLQLQYRRQLSKGVQILASYTWSHSTDNGSLNSTLNELQHASSNFDVRHNFQSAFTFDVPGNYRQRAMSVLLTQWSLEGRISARSAFPVDITRGAVVTDPSTGLRLAYHPNLVPGQPLYIYAAQYPGGRVINFLAFVAAPSGDGNTPRNYARGFDAIQADMGLRREIPIHENVRLQFRAEAFNVFNHPSFGSVTGTLSSGAAQFGRATNTLNTQPGSLSPIYRTGGPRSLQLMLKLTF